MLKTLLLITLFPSIALALVDMRNANFADPWTDIEVSGSGYDLSVKRTYNSRSLYNGMFGFGWCSSFETKLEPKSDGTLVLTECGAGNETVFYPKGFKPTNVKSVVEKVIDKMKASGKRFSAKYYNDLSDQLYNDAKKREELAKQYDISTELKNGSVFRANLKSVDKIVYKDNQYVRERSDSTTEVFNNKGRMVRKYDKNNNYLVFEYDENGHLNKIKDNKEKQLNFSFYKNGKVKEIVGPNGAKSTYKYDNQDLVENKNAWDNKYTYKYDDLHNLTHIYFPDKTYKKISYDKNKDWVTEFRHRDGCVESYNYIPSKENPKRRYKATLQKKCKDKVITKSEYDFWFKPSKTGQGDYLAKVASKVNGKETEVEYHPIHEKPVVVKENGITTRYAYYSNGLIKKKKVGDVLTQYKYHPKCKKVKVLQVDKVVTQFDYDKSCNITTAKSSSGLAVKLDYDRNGRVVGLIDQAKRKVLIKYENKFGKPSVVTRPGVGSLVVKYKDNGEIDKVDSEEGASVAVQVARVFNNLVELIRPAGVELGI